MFNAYRSCAHSFGLTSGFRILPFIAVPSGFQPIIFFIIASCSGVPFSPRYTPLPASTVFCHSAFRLTRVQVLPCQTELPDA